MTAPTEHNDSIVSELPRSGAAHGSSRNPYLMPATSPNGDLSLRDEVVS